LWPACPVVIHSSNTDRAWSMHNELRFAGWHVERVGPMGKRVRGWRHFQMRMRIRMRKRMLATRQPLAMTVLCK
jgi:hypothetical protein